MKTHFTCASILALAFAATAQLPSATHGQTTSATPATSVGTRVAVIDISHVFRNHPGFKQSMEAMKAEVTAFENQLRGRGEKIQKLQEQMKGFKPSSAEYKKIEGSILRLQADGQAAATMKKKDFLERESTIYFDTYNEVANEVGRFAEQHNIGLVVRFNSEPIDPEARNSVLEGVNRAVVYQKNLNITFAVLDRLKRKTTAQQPARNAPVRN